MIQTKKIISAKPIQDEKPALEGAFISELPNYDLPTKGQKTTLEHYENKEKVSVPNLKESKEYPDEWEKLNKISNDSNDTKNPLVLGKGKKSGKFLICKTTRKT